MSERKTLTIGCKLPSGLLMELGSPQDGNYKSLQLNGANQGDFHGRNETGKIFIPKTLNGYGLTEVDSEFFEAWKKKYRINAERWLKEGVLFVASDGASAKANAADNTEVTTGYEQIDPDKSPLAKGLETKPASE
jgi:hypothetical protein